MKARREKILLVENDAAISDVIARQALRPLGYHVDIVLHASAALQEVARLNPHLILANLNLPGLSGKDLLVALQSQGFDIPTIVLAEDTEEGDILEAFRLGAADFLRWPARETEVVAAVERVLKHVRSRQERQALTNQLARLNEELEKRLADLTTLISVGKKISDLTNPKQVLRVGLQGSMLLAQADSGLIAIRSDDQKEFLLRAAENLPAEVTQQINQIWDDGVSNLVIESAQPLAIHGEPLKPFILSKYGQSALIVPLKIKTDTLGTMTLLRKTAQPFDAHAQILAESVADDMAIALLNLRLINALGKRGASGKSPQLLTPAQIKAIHQTAIQSYELLGQLLASEGALLTGRQRQMVVQVQERIQNLLSQLPIL
ncbi:MAG: response regulator [Chloroflexota bacterium]